MPTIQYWFSTFDTDGVTLSAHLLNHRHGSPFPTTDMNNLTSITHDNNDLYLDSHLLGVMQVMFQTHQTIHWKAVEAD